MNSSAKGKRFERKVATILSNWSGLDLGRTPMSGAWVDEPGDIVALNSKFFPFAVECKHQEGWKLDNLIQSTYPFPDWVGQAINQADEKTNRLGTIYWPLLVFTRNREPVYIMLPLTVAVYSSRLSLISYIQYRYPPWLFVVGEASALLPGISYDKVLKYHELSTCNDGARR